MRNHVQVDVAHLTSGCMMFWLMRVNSRLLPFFITLVAALTPLGVGAQTETLPAEAPPVARDYHPGGDGLWLLSHENDWFFGTDRDFTGSVRLAHATPNFENWNQIPLVPNFLAAAFDQASLLYDSSTTVSAAFYAQVDMFTPSDVSHTQPNPNDRPYAGWIGIGVDLIRQTATRRALFETNFGWVGPQSGAEALQKSFHQLIGADYPYGWGSQIKNEPVLQFTYRQDWRPEILTSKNYSTHEPGYDVIGHGLVTVGNGWDYAALGALLRIGYHLPADYGPARLRLGEVESMPYKAGGTTRVPLTLSLDSLAAYVCFGAEGRAVARDITLEGDTFADGPSVHEEPLVNEYYGGLVVNYGPLRTSFLATCETRTFYGEVPASQWRGVITIGCAF
jgi:hypothetical protein